MYELYFCRANLYGDSVVGQLSLPDQPEFGDGNHDSWELAN